MLLNRQNYFIKEHVGLLKLTDTYDLLDPETQQPIGLAKEEPPGWAIFLRLLVNKQMLPTRVNVYEADGTTLVFSIRRPLSFLRSKVTIENAAGVTLGYFQSQLLSIGGAFRVFVPQNQAVADVKGDWKGWNFRFLDKNGTELGTVTKKWAGLGKELFTSADSYMIALTGEAGGNPALAVLLLAAGLAVDIVYKEGA